MKQVFQSYDNDMGISIKDGFRPTAVCQNTISAIMHPDRHVIGNTRGFQ